MVSTLRVALVFSLLTATFSGTAIAQCSGYRDRCPGELTYANGKSRQFAKQGLTGGLNIEFVRTLSDLAGISDLDQFGKVAISQVASIDFAEQAAEVASGFLVRRGTITLRDRSTRSDVLVILGIKGHPKFLESHSKVIGPDDEEWKLEDPWPGTGALVSSVRFNR